MLDRAALAQHQVERGVPFRVAGVRIGAGREQRLGRAEAAPGDRAEQGRLVRSVIVHVRAMIEQQADRGTIVVPDRGEQAVKRGRAAGEQVGGKGKVPAPGDRMPKRGRLPLALREGRCLQAETEIKQEVGSPHAVLGLAAAGGAAEMEPVAPLLVADVQQIGPGGEGLRQRPPAKGPDIFADAGRRHHERQPNRRCAHAKGRRPSGQRPFPRKA
jgi:hypothetical protein